MKRAGDVIAGRYRLIESLGKGGMGEVWRAEHLTLHSPVAVKLLNPLEIKDGTVKEAEQRFEREARAAAALSSPHVVKMTDHGVQDGVAFIVMELLEGETLAHRLERERVLTPKQTLRVVTHVGRALAKAHEAGIIHRDVKPDNIFIVNDEEEIVKLLDFGVVKMERSELSNVSKTKSGAIVGTPLYMSPEQLRAKAVDARSDVWSLAIVAYQCLCGATPYSAESLADLIMQITRDQIPKPSELATVPREFDVWFERATKRDPNQRYSSVKEAIDALRPVLDDAPDIAARISISSATRQVVVIDSPTLAASTHSVPKTRPRSMMFAGLAGIALIVIIAVWWSTRRVPQTPVTAAPILSPVDAAVTAPIPTPEAPPSLSTIPSTIPSAISSAVIPSAGPSATHDVKKPKPKPSAPAASSASNPLAF